MRVIVLWVIKPSILFGNTIRFYKSNKGEMCRQLRQAEEWYTNIYQAPVSKLAIECRDIHILDKVKPLETIKPTKGDIIFYAYRWTTLGKRNGIMKGIVVETRALDNDQDSEDLSDIEVEVIENGTS